MSGRGAEPKGRTIEDVIAIGASAASIWAILADVGGWPGWNPLYPEAAGTLRRGETLHLAVALPGHKPQPTRVTIMEATPDRRFRYRSRPLGGLILGDRFVEISSTGPSRCTVRNGETLGGLLGSLLARMLGAAMKTAFQDMNAALKARAER